MLIPVNINGKEGVALILDDIWKTEDATDYYNSLVDMFETCLCNEEVFEILDRESIFYIFSLIKSFGQSKKIKEKIKIVIDEKQKGGTHV